VNARNNRDLYGKDADLDNPSAPLVCVDLNGVLDRYAGWKNPDHWDPPREGAREFLKSLADRGYEVVIFTSRHPDQATRWLRTHGLLEFVRTVTDRKPPAHVFVDDRAVCFHGDFDETLRSIDTFKAHWE
jgi:hypothetical protein